MVIEFVCVFFQNQFNRVATRATFNVIVLSISCQDYQANLCVLISLEKYISQNPLFVLQINLIFDFQGVNADRSLLAGVGHDVYSISKFSRFGVHMRTFTHAERLDVGVDFVKVFFFSLFFSKSLDF